MTDWFSIPHLTGVRVTGEDATAFCQAQFTADFREFAPDRWRVTAWCDPKGRCLAIILAAAGEGRVDLVLPASQASLLARLKMYAIGRKLSFSEPAPVAGTFAPTENDHLVSPDPARALRLLDDAEIVNPPQARPDAVRAWRIADLCQPVPWLMPASSAKFLPQFLGLEDNEGLSYTKGCFPGQEVIARLHYLGRTKYHLLGFELPVGNAADLERPDQLATLSGEPAGEILNCLNTDGQLIGLAVSPIAVEPGAPAQLPHGPEGQVGRMTEIQRLCYYQRKLSD
jgi:folate-binding protein YgfZ